MNVLLSGGGTGGHVYPALAVVERLAPAVTRLRRRESVKATDESVPANVTAAPESPQMLWVGSDSGMEEALVMRAGVPYAGISTGQLRVMNPVRVMSSLRRMGSGVRQSLAIVDSFGPDVCLVTGGYVCGPVVVACALRKVPVLIYLPDITPGYAIRWLSRLAKRVAVTFPEVARWFGGEVPAGKAVVTGYPVRQELVDAAQDRAAARRALAVALKTSFEEADGSTLPLLLIWGGSQGARAINQATWEALPGMLPYAQILHVVGNRDWPLYEGWSAQHPLSVEQVVRYHPVAYLHEEMPLALAAADLTVARAGASTLGELPVAGLPAILAPYAGVNQMDNAQALARRGGAVIIQDAALPTHLAPTVKSLLLDESRLRAMRESLEAVARPDAALAIATTLIAMATPEVTEIP